MASRSNAADGYLGDWLPHKPNCRCVDCQLERAASDVDRLKKVLRSVAGQEDAEGAYGHVHPRIIEMVEQALAAKP